MALPMLVNNAECGPSNPLQSISKRFDQDRGVLQDRVIAGSSREAFRSSPSQNDGVDQDATRFFGHSQSMDAGRFNFGSMAASLPAIDTLQYHQSHQNKVANAGWASDFLMNQVSAPQMDKQMTERPQTMAAAPVSGHQMNVQPWNAASLVLAPTFVPHIPMHSQQQRPLVQQTQSDHTVWNREFDTQAQTLSTSQNQQVENQMSQVKQDDLARTAGMLLETVKHESNPKFRSSAFMGLMEQLRDGKMTVEGNHMVETIETSFAPGSSSSRGKGKAVDRSMYQGGMSHQPNMMPGQTQFIPDQSGVLQHDEIDEYLRQENADFTRFWSDVNRQTGQANPPSTEWDQLQQDWDNFEATATGIRPIDAYKFQHNNPYLLGDSARTRTHTMHNMTISENVLELESIVQRDPSNARAWYDLGVKQQENEREYQALQALAVAVELEPDYLESWLALAVSHTNDGNRAGTFTAVYEWVKKNSMYAEIVRPHLEGLSDQRNGWDFNDSRILVDCLMAMARAGMGGGVDADVQIALAVLFNSNEDYDKAQDCFRTALDVRPDDWLLYNRVGATMANNGYAEEALKYYSRALEMNPAYVRARFNLGISCITLKRYNEAAQHILDALVLQESDAAPDLDQLNDKRGLMSRALWDSLKTACLHMQRLDLAILCDQRDLEGFRQRFSTVM